VKLKPVVLREVAAQDVEAALSHYVEQSGPSLGLAFVDALEAAIRHIAVHPQSGSARYAMELGLPEVRFWNLKRFPYLIFYVERESELDVWRVLHGQRDIPAWLQR
jgi:toxin ParE1/3/4